MKSNKFTLIEMLIVMGILIVLIGLVSSVSGTVINHKKKSQIKSEITVLEYLIEKFYDDKGYYPSYYPISTANSTAYSDFQQYLVDEKLTKHLPLTTEIDLYGTLFRYVTPGIKNTGSFDIWSLGKDGVTATDDDIGNW